MQFFLMLLKVLHNYFHANYLLFDGLSRQILPQYIQTVCLAFRFLFSEKMQENTQDVYKLLQDKARFPSQRTGKDIHFFLIWLELSGLDQYAPRPRSFLTA